MPEGPFGGPRPFAEGRVVISHKTDNFINLPRDITNKIEDTLITPPQVEEEPNVFKRGEDHSVNIMFPPGSQMSIKLLSDISDKTKEVIESEGGNVFKTRVTSR